MCSASAQPALRPFPEDAVSSRALCPQAHSAPRVTLCFRVSPLRVLAAMASPAARSSSAMSSNRLSASSTSRASRFP